MKLGEQPLSEVEMIGSIRTFGETGPMYEVMGFLDSANVKIRVIETGEEVDYPLEAAQADPLTD